MTTLAIYMLDAYIVGVYLLVVLDQLPLLELHKANAWGGVGLLVATLLATGWNPLLVLTIVFSTAGWVGLWRDHRDERAA